MLLSCQGIISLRPRFGKEKNGRILIDRFVGFAESAIQVEDDEPFAAAFLFECFDGREGLHGETGGVRSQLLTAEEFGSHGEDAGRRTLSR
jgi:hypothetical protein